MKIRIKISWLIVQQKSLSNYNITVTVHFLYPDYDYVDATIFLTADISNTSVGYQHVKFNANCSPKQAKNNKNRDKYIWQNIHFEFNFEFEHILKTIDLVSDT